MVVEVRNRTKQKLIHHQVKQLRQQTSQTRGVYLWQVGIGVWRRRWGSRPTAGKQAKLVVFTCDRWVSESDGEDEEAVRRRGNKPNSWCLPVTGGYRSLTEKMRKPSDGGETSQTRGVYLWQVGIGVWRRRWGSRPTAGKQAKLVVFTCDRWVSESDGEDEEAVRRRGKVVLFDLGLADEPEARRLLVGEPQQSHAPVAAAPPRALHWRT